MSLLFYVILLLCRATLLSARVLYVAPDATPHGDGSLENPFQLAAARNFLSGKCIAQATQCQIWLRGGRYLLESTFTLNASDSGSENAPVVYQSYPGERAELVGGIAVPGRIASPHFCRPCTVHSLLMQRL